MDKSSDDEQSCDLELTPSSCITKSSQNLTNISPNEDMFNFPGTSSSSNPNFAELSLNHRGSFSEEKVAEFKALLSKVNDAYLNWKMNEFILDTIKTKSTSWAQPIKVVVKSSEIQRNIHLRSENGETTNLLGLDEEDMKPSTSTSVAFFSKSAFQNHAVEVLRANISKLKLQKKSLQDKFGAHSMKTMVSMVTKERSEQLEMYKHVEDLQNQACQLLSRNGAIAQQLATIRHDSDRHLQEATFALLQSKALHLQTVTSLLKEKLDQSLYVDENIKNKMDSEGDNLKTQVAELSGELKALQKTLVEYETKEAASDKYKEIVAECGKLKMQLDHKYQTLAMLNDPDMTF